MDNNASGKERECFSDLGQPNSSSAFDLTTSPQPPLSPTEMDTNANSKHGEEFSDHDQPARIQAVENTNADSQDRYEDNPQSPRHLRFQEFVRGMAARKEARTALEEQGKLIEGARKRAVEDRDQAEWKMKVASKLIEQLHKMQEDLEEEFERAGEDTEVKDREKMRKWRDWLSRESDEAQE
jgi:hypothetical protein